MTAGNDDSTPRPRSPRMGRDERRAQVLRIAQELFSTEGFHHVSMDDIAERADVSKPVLYRHFPSKLDLYLAVVDQRGIELLAAVESAMEPLETGPVQPGDGAGVVAAVVRAYMTFVEGAGESSALLFESDVMHDPDVRIRVESASSQATARVAGMLARVTGLDDEQAGLLAVSLTAMAQTSATHRYRRRDELDLDSTAALVARLAWGGVTGLVRPDFEYGAST